MSTSNNLEDKLDLRSIRLAVDTGGTFTDLVIEDGKGQITLHKSATTPEDPITGVLNVLDVAATELGTDRQYLLAQSDLFIHATTHATNAILTGSTAQTALLTTAGHPDVLLFREGGRINAFDSTQWYPKPFIPRALTFEVHERIGANGEIVKNLDETALLETIKEISEYKVESVAVCLLWSIVNGHHERRIGDLLEEHLPDTPYTLSHRLNPSIREYRRMISTAIDASLKPLMRAYLLGLTGRLEEAGFRGRVLMVTATGGVLDAQAVAEAPIHALGSGPAMAPIGGRYYAAIESQQETVVVADTGGTSYDVSLVRRGQVLSTKETWLGAPYLSDMTGFPSIDVKSIGAGGGSIAWVDQGGLLRLGPESAGSDPGPACYDRGGTKPTVTDAALSLGYLDPDYFLGGSMRLIPQNSKNVINRDIGTPLGLNLHDAAAAVMTLATEHMVGAIEEITLNQGIDPRQAILVGGGGAAGLNSVAIARRLGCSEVVIPPVGAVLSAGGALMSELMSQHRATLVTTSDDFQLSSVSSVLNELGDQCRKFIEGPGSGAVESRIEFFTEARYPHQITELEINVPYSQELSPKTVKQLELTFHEAHLEVFAINDPDSPVEFVSWGARARCRVRKSGDLDILSVAGVETRPCRQLFFSSTGYVSAPVYALGSLDIGSTVSGPAIVESPVTTIVVDPDAHGVKTANGSILICTTSSAARDHPLIDITE